MPHILMARLRERPEDGSLSEPQQNDLCAFLKSRLLPAPAKAVYYGTEFSGMNPGSFLFLAVYDDIDALEEGTRIISGATNEYLKLLQLKPYHVFDRSIFQVV